LTAAAVHFIYICNREKQTSLQGKTSPFAKLPSKFFEVIALFVFACLFSMPIEKENEEHKTSLARVTFTFVSERHEPSTLRGP
jgi:hypothetical protein